MGGVIVSVHIRSVKLVDLVVATGEQCPENLDQGEQEDNTRTDGDRDEDDDASREEV